MLVVVEDPAAARAANLHNHDRPSIFFNFVGAHELQQQSLLVQHI